LFIIKIADLKIAIDNKYDYVFAQCTEYICSSERFDFSASASEDEIIEEQKIGGFEFNKGYLESICIYRSIAKQLPKYNAFVMHGAAIEYNGRAYCFTAKSGTGKTTHIMLWKKNFGEQVRIINGDKPIIRYVNDEFIVYGTPWCGKEGFGNNINAPLSGICFLEREAVNSITACSHHEALNKLLPQVFLSKDNGIFTATVQMIDNILTKIPLWNLKCNISDEAAILSRDTMYKKV